MMLAHCEPCSACCSSTKRTARSRTSVEYRFAVPIDSILSHVGVSGKAGAVQTALAGAFIALLAFARVAPARIEEMVVTAQKREESIQNVPITIAAVSAAVLDENEIDNVYTLQTVVPALQVQSVEQPPGMNGWRNIPASRFMLG
jgi:outer membrane receptor protein involved in Fe transport